MPKMQTESHWKQKIRAGTYVSPASSVGVWKKWYLELLDSALTSGLMKAEQLPWMDASFAQNPFVTTRFTGRTLLLQLRTLASGNYVTLHEDPDKEKGFFGIIQIDVPKEHLAMFNSCPVPSRMSVYSKHEDRKQRHTAWKTLDKIWNTFGMREENIDGTTVFMFDKFMAEKISKRHQYHKKTSMEVEEAANEQVKPFADGKEAENPLAALEMLANVSTAEEST